jgi:hypothetical protein
MMFCRQSKYVNEKSYTNCVPKNTVTLTGRGTTSPDAVE